ncbi:MAG: hypothetical protein LBK67_03490, partial [Coriobacteriales bacterium]|nr:hypothetical protein [Coriobacteriales bacterium]
ARDAYLSLQGRKGSGALVNEDVVLVFALFLNHLSARFRVVRSWDQYIRGQAIGETGGSAYGNQSEHDAT